MKKRWKPITGLFSAVLLTASLLAGPAAAEEENTVVIDYPDVGLSICIPYEDLESWDMTKGGTETRNRCRRGRRVRLCTGSLYGSCPGGAGRIR